MNEDEQNSDNFFVMSVITVENKNHFKTFAREAKGKVLSILNTSWYHGYWNCEAFDLFSVKTVDTNYFYEFFKRKELKHKIKEHKDQDQSFNEFESYAVF